VARAVSTEEHAFATKGKVCSRTAMGFPHVVASVLEVLVL
jgi:hypothetical protein